MTDYQMGMDQYLLIPFLGDEHPFTSYFDVHQGYKVLTHCRNNGQIYLTLYLIYYLAFYRAEDPGP